MRNRKSALWGYTIALVGMVGLIQSCSKDESGELPKISTADISEIKDITATGGGTITSNGGSKITAMGICWSKENLTPSITDNFTPAGTYTFNGIEESEWNYNGLMKDLSPNTTYQMRAYASNENGVAYGEIKTFTTKKGKTFHTLTPSMIETFTQEVEEGPKEDLIDGKLDTYWHSAYSDEPGAEVHPLPHWIQMNFTENKNIGGFVYWHRNPSGAGGRPTKFDLQTSSDGSTWTTVWTSAVLPNTIVAATYNDGNTITFGQNFNSKHFRLRILETASMADYTYLAELKVFEDGLTL